MSFAKYFFFKIGFPSWVSSEVLKNKLKSPLSTTFLFIILRILFSISNNSVGVSNCSFSSFPFERLTSRSSLSHIFLSSIKIPPWSWFLVSTTSNDFEPWNAIATPQEFVVPWEQRIYPLRSLLHCFSSSKEEYVSCKQKQSHLAKSYF